MFNTNKDPMARVWMHCRLETFEELWASFCSHPLVLVYKDGCYFMYQKESYFLKCFSSVV